jgi:hypothetical protein
MLESTARFSGNPHGSKKIRRRTRIYNNREALVEKDRAMKELFDQQSKVLAFDFMLEEYFKAGFGTLGKSDLDLLFFSTLLKYARIEDKSDYALSKTLEITQTRVRNLKIKNCLKYAPLDRKSVEEVFIEKARYARLEDDGKRISLPIYDPNLYIELENFIEKENGYVEAQLNPKIFTIRIDQFVGLLINFQAEKEGKNIDVVKNEFLQQIRTTLKTEEKFGQKVDLESLASFKDVQKLLLEKGVDFGLELLLSTVPGGTFVKKLVQAVYTGIRGVVA